MGIRIKTFITQKEGALQSCQDRIAYNLDEKIFAVADGVTNSYHPEFIANAICELFVCNNNKSNDWEKYFLEHILPEAGQKWQEKTEEYRSTLNERELKREMIRRDRWKYGATTFAGIAIDTNEDTINYHILGDSTLFVINDKIESLCTSGRQVTDGVEYIMYDNRPRCILSNAEVIGNIISGTIPLKEGYVALMTDGAAEWLQGEIHKDKSSIEKIWGLSDHKEFEKFVKEQRTFGKMDDDIAIVILKIEDEWKNTEIEPVYLDTLESPAIVETKESGPMAIDFNEESTEPEEAPNNNNPEITIPEEATEQEPCESCEQEEKEETTEQEPCKSYEEEKEETTGENKDTDSVTEAETRQSTLTKIITFIKNTSSSFMVSKKQCPHCGKLTIGPNDNYCSQCGGSAKQDEMPKE